MTEPVAVVKAFCDMMARRDADLLRPYLDDKVSYQNTGMRAVVGIDAVVEDLAGQFAMFPDSYEYRVINIAATDDGKVVLTERLDMIRTSTGVAGIPVMGTFAVADGKIARWTDYWDTALPAKMAGGEDTAALVPSSY